VSSAVGLVADLWRYPVKSFAGERTRRVFVGPFGLHGDRRFTVISSDGTPQSARRASALLGFGARFRDAETAEGVTVRTPDGRELDVLDSDLRAQVCIALEDDVELARQPMGVFDAAVIHVITDASLRQVDTWLGEEIDPRRFRPNIVLELDAPEPFAEADWVGRRLAIDDGPTLEVVSPTERCAVTTFDPDTVARDKRVLFHLATERENLFGVYAQVVTSGWLSVGARVHLDD
jgi:uncharacterized protein